MYCIKCVSEFERKPMDVCGTCGWYVCPVCNTCLCTMTKEAQVAAIAMYLETVEENARGEWIKLARFLAGRTRYREATA